MKEQVKAVDTESTETTRKYTEKILEHKNTEREWRNCHFLYLCALCVNALEVDNLTILLRGTSLSNASDFFHVNNRNLATESTE